MKNIFFGFMAVLFFSATASAQTTSDSIASKYFLLPMPAPLTIEKTFPVLGSYQLNDENGPKQVLVTLDADNKGIIWVEGLTEGRFKAYLKRSPATYRIISQKTESGKNIPEGTIVFEPETGALNIALGKSFDNADPNSVFLMNGSGQPSGATEVKVKTPKSKTKLQFYTAIKQTEFPAITVPVTEPAVSAQ
jgi:hypothetical protein